MAVLVEGISVVIRRDAIVRTFGPSWDAFVVAVPNRTLCADPEIARVGFMHPDDVQAYVVQLGTKGMLHLRTENAVDLVVVDQLRGPTSHCDWLDFGSVDLQGHKVSALRHLPQLGVHVCLEGRCPVGDWEGHSTRRHGRCARPRH
jgi:hypothetical protein